ncbi:MAG: acyl-CoA/acyl-ACP dehydrogenase [Helicobacter sp.]|nr:acyl-CoA/acyl-ACP dehydrogenase [Helicobacter sp.]MDD7567617.1 acyl-CoA/acyl-ACP dehydrogenase [Helicobacter sp.]MDY5740944.1 acyl-CoA dehydrogenase family protein [Helicobacter sp.]
MLTLQNLIHVTQEFTEKYVAPFTERTDTEARFPTESYEALKAQGYMGLLVPKEYGGLGGGNLHHSQVCYALARSCATTALCYMMHNTATAALASFGSDGLKSELLPKIAKGEITLALAYSESGSGTHFGLPDIQEKEQDNKRILSGRKSFVTAAQHADYYVTYTNSCKIKDGKNTWLVHKDSPNLVHESTQWQGIGMRGNASMPVQYNDVKVDGKYQIGNEGEGENHAGIVVMYFVVGLGAVYSGLGFHAYATALKHIKERRYTTGGTLSDVELVRIHLADIYAKTQSSIALVFDAAQSFDSQSAESAAKIFACRINATHNVMDICSLAMRLGGGKAYNKALPLERLLRDAFASQVMAPSLDVLKVWLGQELVK